MRGRYGSADVDERKGCAMPLERERSEKRDREPTARRDEDADADADTGDRKADKADVEGSEGV